MTSTQCVGYSARTLPNLVQRKPWSNTPWDRFGVIRGIWDKMGILVRRGMNIEQAGRCWKALSGRWCKLQGVPVSVLSTPTGLGGFGVGIWDGETTVVSSLGKVAIGTGFEIERKTDYRVGVISKRITEMGLRSNEFDLNKMADDELQGVVSADDVPQAALIMRREWDKLMYSNKWVIKGKRIGEPLSFGIPAWYSSVYTLLHDQKFIGFESLVASIDFYSDSYGQFKKAVEVLRELSKLEEYRIAGKKIDKWDYMKLRYPAFVKEKNRLCRRGHVSEVLDYLEGKINLNEHLINNDINDIYTRFCLVWLKTLHRDLDILKVYFKYRALLLGSFSQNPVYRYCFSQV